MHPPKLAKVVLRFLARRRDGAYLGDVEEIYRDKAEGLGLDSADLWYWREAVQSLPKFIAESIRWGLIMFTNYLKTAARIFRRDKGYSLLNLAGLAIGMACFALLMMWVRDEVGWDRFHENSPRIYRLESDAVPQPAPLAPFLKANYPEIAAAVRFLAVPFVVKNLDRSFDERGFVLADPSAFDIFTIPFSAGNRDTAFAEPDTVVLTEAAAKKYFGGDDPLGRVLTVENRIQVRVTGVVRNPPRNSDIQFAILGNFAILRHFNENYESAWGNHAYFTYVKLAPSAAAEAVIPKIARIVMDREASMPAPLTLKPLGRIHLYEDGAIKSVVIFALVAVFILLVAACNFVNLTTARSGKRAREIAVRKVAGAARAQLVMQFLSESVLLALGAFLVALAVAAPVLPAFNAVTGKDFSPAGLLQPGVFLSLLGTAVIIGLLSGAYPALLLSSFRPAGLLKDGGGPRAGRSSGGSRFRKVLVVAQFSVSIVLMISTLFIAKQVAFVRDYDLGIQKENIVYLPAKEPVIENHEAFIRELAGQPGVVNATFVSSLPSQVDNVASGMEWEGMSPGLKPVWSFVDTDERYLDTLGLTLVEGRNFPEGKSVQEAPYFIVNQRAAEDMKIKNPVGTRFSMWGWNGTVLGVVKDFHFRSLHEEVRPLLLFVLPRFYSRILIKIRPEGRPTAAVLDRIEDVWEKFAPGMPFSYEFLDAAFAWNYQAERKMGLEFKYFSFLGIFISLLGLVGLAAYMAEQKRKEIGIRKVLGATVAGITGQINKEFVTPILLANLIAWPVAYWAMATWLQGFAYRARLSIEVFFMAGFATLAFALITVSFQAVKAARANPVQSLKRE